MKTTRWIRPFLFTLLVLVAPFVGYYVYHVGERETFFLDRFHAHLANTAARTEARVSSAFDVIKYNCKEDLDNELGVDSCTEEEPSAETQQRAAKPATPTVSKVEGRLEFAVGPRKASVAIPALIGDIDPERQFYDIAILDEEGGVVFQRGAASGRLGDNPWLKSGTAEAARKAESDESSYNVNDSLANMRVTHQGKPFLLFAQPLQMPTSDGKAWKIIGLLEENRFNELKYDLPLRGVGIAALIVLAVLFASPFLKLWYLGRFEPLTRSDILLQAGAGLSLVAMLTVALLAWNTSARLSTYFDNRLSSITADLRSSIREEVGTAATALHLLEPAMVTAYETRLARNPPDWERARAAGNACPALARPYDKALPPITERDLPTEGGDLLTRLPEKTSGYRQLIMAYLMDQNGCQIVKWSSASQWTKPGSFPDRAYFRSALPDERVPLALYSPDGIYAVDFPFFEEAIVSRTTGEREIVFSKSVDKADDCTTAIRRALHETAAVASVPCVSVVTAKLRALDSVLPFGYGAMLVDRDANIVLRGDRDASTELNLANEIDVPDRLRGLIQLATKDGALLDADYRQAPHRFLVDPLDVGDLTLVAFYNRNLVFMTVLEAVGAAVAAWLVFAAVLVTLAVLLRVADDMTERSLRRPLALGATLLALAVIAFWAGAPAALVLSAAGIPAAFSVLALLPRKEGSDGSSLPRRVWIIGAIWCAVYLAAQLPMRHFYDDAEQRVLSALGRFEAHEYVREKELQHDAFEAWKHRVGVKDSNWNSFAAWRGPWLSESALDPKLATESSTDSKLSPPSEASLDAQAAASASLTDSGSPLPSGAGVSPCKWNIVCLILRQLPDYNPDVVGIHAMYGAPELAQAELGQARNAMLDQASDRHTALYGLVYGLFMALTAAAIWYLLVRTFGLRPENMVRLDSFAAPGPDDEARYLVYGAPAAEKRRRYFDALPAKPDGRLWLDLRDMPADAQVTIAESTDVIALDEFDANLNDIEVVRRRVELLERLFREERRVIVLFVNTEPLNFINATFDDEKHAALLARVAATLARFQLTYYDDGKRVDGDKTSVGTRIVSTLKGQPAKRRQSAEMSERLHWRRKLIAKECRHPDLWGIRDELLRDDMLPKVQELSEAQIIQQVQNRASSIYQHMWSRCTRVEKFTLIELARGNPVNPNNWDSARRLRVRGYVRLDPFYRIASESLRQFVIRMERTEDVDSWRAGDPGAWDQIKVPLIIVFIGVLAFLALTQPNLFNNVFAFLAAGAATFPFIVSALTSRFGRAATGGGN